MVKPNQLTQSTRHVIDKHVISYHLKIRTLIQNYFCIVKINIALFSLQSFNQIQNTKIINKKSLIIEERSRLSK